MNGFSYRRQELFCEDVAVSELAAHYGTPLYVYSQSALLDNYRAVNSAFNAVMPTTIGYSVKSCSNIHILKLLADEGCGFDIVSGGELFRVLRAGGNPRQTVFAGVAKTVAEIRAALEADILMFNCESEAEVERINEVAGAMQKIAAIALRINPDIDAGTHAKTTTAKKENKFGIAYAHAQALLPKIGKLKNVVLRGIDVHLGSPINTLAPYALAAEKIREFLRAAPDTVTHLDLGGGLGLVYHEEKTPSFAEYAQTIAAPFADSGKQLIIEPGRSLVGNTAILLAEIQYRKTNGEKTFYLTDTGMNDLIRPAMYDAYHFIWSVKTATLPAAPFFPENPAVVAKDLEAADITGPICESSDVFARGRLLPPCGAGEVLAIFSAGAYGFSMSSNYNSRPRPAEILVHGAVPRVIRRRETYADLVRGEE